MRRFTVLAALAAGLLMAFLPAASAGNGPKSGDTHVQLLAFNDFHGALESGGTVQVAIQRDANGNPVLDKNGKEIPVTVPAGGIAYMATMVKQLEATSPNSFVVSAGDNIGASPLISAAYHDEPTIEALNQLGLFVSAVGNHEFDEGPAELMRMQYGGCNGGTTCPEGSFAGASFSYLASNVVWAGTGETIFPSYKVVKIGNAKLAFIGATLKDAPSIITAAGVAGLEFRPEAAAVNAVVHMLREEQGVRSFVLLLHQGGAQGRPYGNPAGDFPEINGCANFTGDIVPVIDQLDPQVDVVVSGHSHNAYNCRIDGKLVTAASSSGKLLTDIDLTIDHQTKDVSAATATNLIVNQNTIVPNPAMAELVAHYKALSAPIANQVVGAITANITRTGNAAGESQMGDVIADGQLFAMQPQSPVAAITNPGGLRADLTGGPRSVTYGDLFAVQPFANYMVVKDVTGQQLMDALEQQWSGPNATSVKVLQVSAGFTYSYSASAPAGHKVVPGTFMIGGLPVDPLGTYRVAMNNFLSDGGDNFTALRGGTNAFSGMYDIDAAVAYFQANASVAPGPQNRITVTP